VKVTQGHTMRHAVKFCNKTKLDRRLQGIALTCTTSLPPRRVFSLGTQSHTYPGQALANWAHHAATSAFSTNSLRRRRCCCKPTAHCNISRDPVDTGESPPLL